MRRYALYYAPRRDEPIARFARSWLGRDPETGSDCPRVAIAGLAPARLNAITTDPRHYGFHGTLKPPFQLADGVSESDFLSRVLVFASARKAFQIDAIKLHEIGSFIALTPQVASAGLNQLANDCVSEFDRFRKPATPDELARRRAAGLSERQDELLVQWGYPYVFDEFRFHLTLTNSLKDAAERGKVRDALTDLTVRICARPLQVRDLVVFMQEAKSTDFKIVARFPLGGV